MNCHIYGPYIPGKHFTSRTAILSLFLNPASACTLNPESFLSQPVLHINAGNPVNPAPSLKGPETNTIDLDNAGIGTANPDSKLTVKGKIRAEEVKVDLSVAGPDYVFEDDYELPSLKEIEAFINVHKHLTEVPSAKEVEEGQRLGEMQLLLLKK